MIIDSIGNYKKRLAGKKMEYYLLKYIALRNSIREAIQNHICRAQVSLYTARGYRKARLIQHLRAGDYCPTIYWESTSEEESIGLIGDFTTPPWKKIIPSVYDHYFHCHKVTAYMKEGTKFKFVINGRYCTSPHYMVSVDKSSISNNVYSLNHKPPLLQNIIQNINTKTFKKPSLRDKMQILDLSIKEYLGFHSTDNISLKLPNHYIHRTMSPKDISELAKLTFSNYKDTNYFVELATGIIPSDESTESFYLDQKILKFQCGAANIKRDDKLISEDSYFISENAIGLADGVGGWAQYGINSSDFSSELMSRCSALCTINKYIDPIKLLSAAYRSTTSYGSSTAVLCTFSQAGGLTACNLGDSGFMHIKFLCGKAFVVQKSEIQQHDFNIPYQLSKIPSEDFLKTKNDSSHAISLNVEKLKESTFCQDSPDDSDYFQINNAAAGDLILIASDGVYDNLFDHEILSIIQSHKHLPINANILAQEIASVAYKKSKMQSDVSIPFNERLEQCSHIICDGGKEDDITVVVALLI